MRRKRPSEVRTVTRFGTLVPPNTGGAFVTVLLAGGTEMAGLLVGKTGTAAPPVGAIVVLGGGVPKVTAGLFGIVMLRSLGTNLAPSHVTLSLSGSCDRRCKKLLK